ncbi:hypothetical protein [Streptomyces poonensis]|uniref:Uncharacterized protein n=1 Tax=Streptomyces poonensis TaxID=68255 RepID=A0A918UVH2_9ACTN|nr:hypothetical protein [Streptomyces poonensis]GGZ35774.1 hypothetical protein GCM10010365_65880 [Streptomyces poonensis]GLJ89649.1 hypothetical protein GCM10017589_22490 [Streptomyces poonensis]
MAREESRRPAPHGRLRGVAQTVARLGRPAVHLASATAAVAAELARRVRRYAWPSAAGRRNSAYLRDRLVALPLLAVVAFGAFGWAYAGVRGDLAHVRDRLAPALVDLADAKASLLIAQTEADRNLGDDGAAELSGLSERYRIRVARATQSLNQALRGGALTRGEEQELRVVSALVVDYTAWVARAQGHATDSVLRDAELTYARTMLCPTSPPKDRTGRKPPTCVAQSSDTATTGSAATTIVDRVADLEQRVRNRIAARAAWGSGVITAAAVSGAAFLLLAAGLLRTTVFLRRRFRIRLSVPLAAAAVPLFAVPLLVWDAWRAHGAQDEAVTVADALVEGVTADTEIGAEERPFDRTGPRERSKPIAELASQVDGELAEGRIAVLDEAAPFVLPAGLATAALAGGALHAYRREYLVVVRPGAVS